MARPTSKEQLLSAATTQYDALRQAIDSMTEAEQTAPFTFGPELGRKEAHWDRDDNLRDVLVHLHEWHLLLLNWIESNREGHTVPFLPSPYNWKNYGKMNAEFKNKHRNTSLGEAQVLLDTGHDRVIRLIKEFTNEELFEKKHFRWTGTTSLGSYCVSSTSSHYDWAIKKIRAHLRLVRARS